MILGDRLAKVVAERDTLKAENEALRKDADRYRWLRKTEDWELTAQKLDVDHWLVSSGTGMGNASGKELDDSIDALILTDAGE
ncbi:hypothetical protein D9M71_384090 [compost metagenome]